MSIRKKLLTLVLVVILAFNMFLISASATIEGTDLVAIDVNIEIGTYDVNEDWIPWDGEALLQNDIITVRVAPSTNYFTGGSKTVVMYTSAYFQIQGVNAAAYTVNYANTYYTTSCTNYSGTTNQLPVSAWPAALKPTANGGDGTYNLNTAASWTTQQQGTYPSHMPETWLFSFDLKVLQNITVGSGARVWMDSRWIKTSTNTGISMYSKNLDDSKVTTVGTSQNYPFTIDLTGAQRSLEPYSNEPEDLIVTTTQVGSDFVVNIDNYIATDQYQIWSYQQVTSDLLLDATGNVKANQWILSNAYTAGSLGTPSVPADGTINFTIPTFTSPTDNFIIAVRVADAAGNFKQEVRDAYTPEDLGIVVIDKILVDDVVTTGYELKEIVGGAETLIKVIGNDEVGITYSAKVVYGPEIILEADLVNTNEFLWDISTLTAGVYTIEITADNGSTSAIQEVTFELYNLTPLSPYASIDDMTLDLVAGGVNITPDFANGTFSYRVREPGRSPSFISGQVSSEDPILYSITAPGVYHVNGYAMRAGLIGTEGGGYDDGLIKTMVIPRAGGGSVSMTLEADQTLPVVRNTAIVFTATATGLTNPQYSFWRYDATGYVLVKDWSSSNTLNWTPARLGEYQLEARAKGDGAGSYEVKKSLEVNITDPVLAKADVTTITLNTGELAAAQAKKPIMLKAAATGTDKDELLYKFFVYDNDMLNQQLRDYTVDQNCVWTPRENGTYTIIVLVKNENSFGKYDAIDSFEVIVD